MVTDNMQALLMLIRMRRFMPYRKLAKEIGIGCPTLMDFLDSKRPPRFVTMAKIAKFIEDNRGVWDKKVGT